jgi:hypothetical protein
MQTACVRLLAAATCAAFATVLAAQTAPATRGDPAAGRGPVVPHAAGDEDARFGAPYSSAKPVTFTADFSDWAQWQKRADFVRHQAMVAEGLWPTPAKTPLNAVVHGKIDKGDYTVEKVYFASLPGHYVTGSLYRPKQVTGKVPAVLMPYGHWGTAPDNGRFWVKTEQAARQDLASGAEKELSNARAPLQASCVQAARMGCIAFQWDLVGFCDSTAIAHQEGFLDAEAVLRLQSFMGLQAWNAVRALDFVASLLEVDPARIAISGSSGGGTQSFIAGMMDDRLAGLFPICMVGPDSQGGCVCENAPLLRVNTNNIEFAATFAPKPQFDVSAQDFTRNFPNVGLPEIKKIYALAGAADSYGSAHVPYPHNHNVHSRENVYTALNKAFKLGLAEPLKEKPFDVLTREQLTVWTPEHPVPSDAGKAADVRAYMTRSNDEQFAALAKDPQAYHSMMRVAVQAMVADQLPLPRDVACSIDLTRTGNVQKGTIGRKGENERIPFACARPAQWNGMIVIVAGPRGAAALDGSSAAGDLRDSGALVVAIDAYMSGEFTRKTPAPPVPGMRLGYSGFSNGYERTILANRVHDLLSLIALARGIEGAKSIRLVASGTSAVAALYAAALAGPALSRTAIDLGGFDFDQVKDANDLAFMPGALKYGGVYGAVLLCVGEGSQGVLVAGARDSGKKALAAATPNVTLREEAVTESQLAAWVIR